MDISKSQTNLGYFYIILAGAGWGTGGYFVAQLSQLGAPSPFISMTSHLFAILPLLLIILVSRGPAGLKLSRKGALFAVLMGITGKAFFLLAYNRSITLVGVSTASILIYVSPIFTSLLSWLVFKTKIGGRQLMALSLNLLASFMVVTGGDFSNLTANWEGIMLGILAAFLYALNTILGKLGTSDDDPITMTFYTLVVSSLTMMVFADPIANSHFLTDKQFLIWQILNAVITGVVANVLYMQGLSMRVDPSRASIVASIEIVVANLLGVLALGEATNIISIAGIFLLLISIVIMNSKPSEKGQVA